MTLLLERLKSELRTDEGLRLKKYICPAGYNTIGYGFNLDANDYPDKIKTYLYSSGFSDNQIPIEVAEFLLDSMAKASIIEARRIFPEYRTYTVRRKAAIANMIYNMGLGTFLKFKNTIQHIKNHHWEYAAQNIESSLYYKQVGERGKRVVKSIRQG